MKWSNDYRMKLMLVGVVAGIVLGGGRAEADFTFGEPVNLGPTVNTASGEGPDCFSSDGLEMYLDSNRSVGYGGWDIYVSKRETLNDDWGIPVNLGPIINTSQGDTLAYISSDGLELYFQSNRPGGYGGWDIWITRRATKQDPWGQPTNLGPAVNSSVGDGGPWISPDGLELCFGSARAGGYGTIDIWISRRAIKNDPWGEPVNLGPIVNSSACEGAQSLSPDGLLLLFSEGKNVPLRPGGFGNEDMWVTRRASVSDPWGTPVNLGPMVNSPSVDNGPRISPDGSTLYFCSERPGGFGGTYGDIYQAPIIPIVDFDGDGNVDALDLGIMLDHWGENYSLCDIGPLPWGDGIVDVEDLKVLTKYLLENYPLAAYWMLDETDGDIASDSAGENDGVCYGEPLWVPDGGMAGGALQFDGMDDYVSTPFVLDPAKGSLSAFAWIQGGGPGQVILSQTGDFGGMWLGFNPSKGTLMTGFSDMYFGVLESESIVAGRQWHHVGLVYDLDTLHRRLYVDGALVAEDTMVVSGVPSNGGLYIGVGKDLDATTFFSGLIDDVRIYNKALSAAEIAILSQ